MTALPGPKPKAGPRGRPWPKGVSGNPRGAPKGSRNRATLALDALGEGRASEIVEAMVKRAVEGDVSAAALVLSRAWPVRKGRPTPLALPEVRNAADTAAALGKVVGAVSSGELTPEEAAAVSAVLGEHRKAIETEDLERRIIALEAQRPPTAPTA